MLLNTGVDQILKVPLLPTTLQTVMTLTVRSLVLRYRYSDIVSSEI